MVTDIVNRHLPWAKVGLQYDSPPATIDDALSIAGLDWQVDMRQLGYHNKRGTKYTTCDEFRGIVRTDNEQLLGVAGKDYIPVDNREALQFLDELTGQGDITHAWQTNGGRQVGVAVRLGDVESLGNIGHKYQPYVVFTTSHDAKQSLRAVVSNIQLACTNQLPSLFRSSKAQWRASHVSTIKDKMRKAADVLRLVNDHSEAYTEFLQVCAGHKFTGTGEFMQLTKQTLDISRMSQGQIDKAFEGIVQTYLTTTTIDTAHKNTAFGLIHIATEYWDHKREYRNPEAAYKNNMATNAHTGLGYLHKQRVLELCGKRVAMSVK